MAKRTFLLPLAFAFAALTQTAEAQVPVNGGAPGPYTGLGWNYGHISYCIVSVDGSNAVVTAAIKEGGYGYTNNPLVIAALAPACQTGNWIGVYVTSLNPFRWTNVSTYDFK